MHVFQLFDGNYAKFIELGRLRLDGHVMRVEDIDCANKIFCTKPRRNEGRRRGRPKLRWRDELVEDVSRVWCRNWRINVQSRDKCRGSLRRSRSTQGYSSNVRRRRRRRRRTNRKKVVTRYLLRTDLGVWSQQQGHQLANTSVQRGHFSLRGQVRVGGRC